MGSLDRRRCNSGRPDQLTSDRLDTSEHMLSSNSTYRNDHTEELLLNNVQYPPQHFNQSHFHQTDHQNYTHNSPRSHIHNTSSSKLKPNNMSHLPTQVHNISSSSLGHAHNTTASSISSSSSGQTSVSTGHKTYSTSSGTQQATQHHSYHHTAPHQQHHSSVGGHHGRNIKGMVSPSYHRSGGPVNQLHSGMMDNSRMHPQQAHYSPHNTPRAPEGVSHQQMQHNMSSSHLQYKQHKSYQPGSQTPLTSRHQYKDHTNDKIPHSGTASVNCSFDNRIPNEDCIDGQLLNRKYHNDGSKVNQNRTNFSDSQNKHSLKNSTAVHANQTLEIDNSSETIHTLVRTNSGRSYMETTFLGDSSSASSTTSNQENIPPVGRGQIQAQLPPLRPAVSHLRASSSITPADMAPPRLIPALDLIPLRATKSSSELPPLKATNPRPDHAQHIIMNNNANLEPLISLAEAAKLKKDREREWYETSLDSPVNGRRTQLNPVAELVVNKVLNHSVSSSNLNTSINSSTGNIYPPSNEGNESQVTSSNSRNQAMMITTGTYQPSREESKPFEMSDFYKYSTKYRKQGLGGSSNNSSFSAGSDCTMSPVLPPRAQVVVTSNKTAPPSPNVIAQQSTPSAQQKGVYQSLAPYTCQGVHSTTPQQTQSSGWDTGVVHQAVPATVTTKRSATLV